MSKNVLSKGVSLAFKKISFVKRQRFSQKVKKVCQKVEIQPSKDISLLKGKGLTQKM